jgi:fermentation-respiration switch protein FrsA (DUF1100 family)
MSKRVVFVHGTGVRQAAYDKSFELVAGSLVGFSVERCFWGGECGSRLLANGASIPTYVARGGKADIDAALEQCRWRALYDDPLRELRAFPTSDAALRRRPPLPGQISPNEQLAQDLEGFLPSQSLKGKLRSAGLIDFWDKAYDTVVRSTECSHLVAVAEEDTIDLRRAIARSIVAQCCTLAAEAAHTVGGADRDNVLGHLIDELHGTGRAILKDFLVDQLRGIAASWATRKISGRRGAFSDATAPFSGDILAYQSRAGSRVRSYIRDRIAAKDERTIVIAHSLGGVAVVDLLVKEQLPNVSHLVTVGSQPGLFYELDALGSMPFGSPLPSNFPLWLNIYDPSDLLSYLCSTVFGNSVRDAEVDNGVPFPESHSAYWSNDTVWNHIRRFVG